MSPNDIYKKFRKILRARKMTYRQLGEKIGYSTWYIGRSMSKLKNGKRVSHYFTNATSAYLGVNISSNSDGG